MSMVPTSVANVIPAAPNVPNVDRAKPRLLAALHHPPEGIMLYPRTVDAVYVLAVTSVPLVVAALESALRELGAGPQIARNAAAVVLGCASEAVHTASVAAVEGLAKQHGGAFAANVVVSPLLFGEDAAAVLASGIEFVDRRFAAAEWVLVTCRDDARDGTSKLATSTTRLRGSAGAAAFVAAADIFNPRRLSLATLPSLDSEHLLSAAVVKTTAAQLGVAVLAQKQSDLRCAVDTALSVAVFEPNAFVTILAEPRFAVKAKRTIAMDVVDMINGLLRRHVPLHFHGNIELMILPAGVEPSVAGLRRWAAERRNATGEWQPAGRAAVRYVLALTDAQMLVRRGLLEELAAMGRAGAAAVDDGLSADAWQRVPAALADDQEGVRRLMGAAGPRLAVLDGLALASVRLGSRQAPRFERLNAASRVLLRRDSKERRWCNPTTLEGCAAYDRSQWSASCTRRGLRRPLALREWLPPTLATTRRPRHFRVVVSVLSSSHFPIVVVDNVQAWLHYCPRCGVVVDSVGGLANETYGLLAEAALLDRVLVNGDEWLEIPRTGQVGQRHLRNARAALRAGWSFERMIPTALNELPFRGGFEEYVLQHAGFDPQNSKSAVVEALLGWPVLEDDSALGPSPRALSPPFAMMHTQLPPPEGGQGQNPYNQFHLWCLAPVSDGSFSRGVPVASVTIAFEGMWFTADDVQRYLQVIDVDATWSADSANEHYFLQGVLLERKLRLTESAASNVTFGVNMNIYGIGRGVLSAAGVQQLIAAAPSHKFSVKRVEKARYFGGSREWLRRRRLIEAGVTIAPDAVNVTIPSAGPLFMKLLADDEGAYIE